MTDTDEAPAYGMRCYHYGCPAKATLDEVAMTQLRMAHDLRNALVEVDLRHQDAVAAIWTNHPALAGATDELAQAQALVHDVEARVLAERVTDRSTKPRAATKAELTTARSQRNAARAALKDAKAAHGDALREQFSAAKSGRFDAIKAARLAAVDAGLFWTTANFVAAGHETAVKKIAADRAAGKSAQLRFHRFDGTGTLTFQVQRGAGMPMPTPGLLSSGAGPWAKPVHLGLTPEPGSKWGTLRMRVRGTKHGDHHLEIPVAWHRPIPEDAEIKEIKVSRRRIASHYRLSVSIVCRVAPVPQKTDGAVLTLSLGWSGQPDRDVRVARITGDLSALPPVPVAIAEMVHRADGGLDVRALGRWRGVLERADRIRSVRDQGLDAIKARVVAALVADPELAATLECSATDVARWKAPRRFALLAARCPQGHSLAAELEVWRQRDKHLWEFEANERDQVIGQRRECYRVLSAWLCDAAALVVISGMDLAQMRRSEQMDAQGEGEDERTKRARALAQFASPGELRATMLNAASGRGTQIMLAGGKESSRQEAA